jgi:type I restriction enzyme S subunit
MSHMPNQTNPKPGAEAVLVPKLRFPEFREMGEWEKSPLSKYVISLDAGVSVVSGNRPAEKNEVGILKTSAVTDGIFRPAQNKVVLSEDELRRVKEPVSEDSIIISRMNTPELVGANAYVTTSLKKIFLPDRLWAAKPKPSASMRFIAFVLGSENGRAALSELATGTSGSMKNITKPDVLGLKITAPSFDEQQKIADCLSSLDELIAAQARKVDALRTHKKGLMQQLFPREGETQPRLRLPEFRGMRDWEIHPIGDNIELLSGYPFDGTDITQDSTGVPLLRGINVTEGRVRHNAEIDRYFTGTVNGLEKYKLEPNDLVIGMDGSKVGKNSALITNADAGALLIQRVARLRTKNVDYIQFIFQEINSSKFHCYVDKINTSSGIPHISAKQIMNFCIAFPSTQEQQRIADCLASVDDIIIAATQELETLKTHKKGLMQQLFPSSEEVAA